MPRKIVLLYRDLDTVSHPVKSSFQTFFQGKGLEVATCQDPKSFWENWKLYSSSLQGDAEQPWFVIGTKFGLCKPKGDDVVAELFRKGISDVQISRISVLEDNCPPFIHLDWCDFQGTWEKVYQQLHERCG